MHPKKLVRYNFITVTTGDQQQMDQQEKLRLALARASEKPDEVDFDDVESFSMASSADLSSL
jgi:hypothetical protein